MFRLAERLSRETGVPHAVDHIIPLTHPDVCGLDVPWNLQVLTASDNSRKRNSFDGTCDNESWRLWRMAEESNPHPEGVITVFETACRPRSETIRLVVRGGIEPPA